MPLVAAWLDLDFGLDGVGYEAVVVCGAVQAVLGGRRRLTPAAVDDPGPQRHLAHPHPPLLVLDDVADSFVVVVVDFESLLLGNEEIRQHVTGRERCHERLFGIHARRVRVWRWHSGRRSRCRHVDAAVEDPGMLARVLALEIVGSRELHKDGDHRCLRGVILSADDDRSDSEGDDSGWRKHEILGLTWDEIDEAGGIIRLSPARSKTLVGRMLPMSQPIAEALERRRVRRDPDSPLVFHRDGIPVRRWRTTWRTAGQAAGVPTRFLHDCRRTAARNQPAPDVRRHPTWAQFWISARELGIRDAQPQLDNPLRRLHTAALWSIFGDYPAN